MGSRHAVDVGWLADPAGNMHRFYRLDVQPDLFGCVLLVKERDALAHKGRGGRAFLMVRVAEFPRR
jgi:hypothetical protein